MPKVTSTMRMACLSIARLAGWSNEAAVMTVGATAGHWDVGPAVSAQSRQLRTGACELAAVRRGPSQAQPGTGACAEQVWQNAVKDGEERSTGSLSTNARKDVRCMKQPIIQHCASMMSTAQQAISLPVWEHRLGELILC